MGFRGGNTEVILVTCGDSDAFPHSVSVHHDEVVAQVEGFDLIRRKAAKGAALLCPLLGITWMIGFLNFSGTLLITEYLFAILNSSQVRTSQTRLHLANRKH